jgi:hypothetical protein
MLMHSVNIRAFTFVFHLTRFPISAQMAAGIGISRVAFASPVEIMTIPHQKRLTSIFFQPTMRLSLVLMYMVDKK